MQHRVGIPAEHFTKSVKKNYNDIDFAIVREFMQNSYDAGATRIDFNLNRDERSLEVIDNGCGMSAALMQSALLTLSGSSKGPTSVGQFGAAKEITIFQHLKYEIHSLTTKVRGSVLDYDMDENQELFHGTRIKIWFHPEHYDFSYDAFRHQMEEFIKSCQIAAKVFVNGEEIDEQLATGELVRTLDWCNIYSTATKVEQNYVTVRIKGVTMFKVYVGSTKFQIVLDITKPSTEIMTVNRDGFNWYYADRLQRLVQEIMIEKGSFGSAYNKRFIYNGADTAYHDMQQLVAELDEMIKNDPAIVETVEQDDSAAMIAADITRAVRSIAAASGVDMKSASKKAVVDIYSQAITDAGVAQKLGEERTQQILQRLCGEICNHQVDFIVYVKAKGYDKVPDHLRPGRMGAKNIALAKLWKRCIKLVLKHNQILTPYAIGWVIDEPDKTIAMHSKTEDGIHRFMLNPIANAITGKTQKALFYELLLTACHEVAHMRQSYHDENFVTLYDSYVIKMLTGIDSWWKEYVDSKNEIL